MDNGISCAITTYLEDTEIPAAAAVLGVLVAALTIGLVTRSGRTLTIGASIAAGLLFRLLMPPSLPKLDDWLIPLTALAAGISVIVSVRPRQLPNHIDQPQGNLP